MNKRSLICSAMLVTAGCTNAGDDSSRPDEDVLTQEVEHSLSADGSVDEGARADGGAQCRGRRYPTYKDNRTPQVPRSDVELIDTLVPHHRAAVEMADMELERGQDAEVKAMAEKMKADQSEEIETLLRIRDELTGCTNVTSFPDPHMRRDMKMMMETSGAELDRMFVDDMIPHHAGALVFTHNALPNLKNAELQALARMIIDAQSMEIGDMHMMKMKLEAGSGDGGVTMATPAPCSSDADCGGAKCMAHAGGSFCDVPEMVVTP